MDISFHAHDLSQDEAEILRHIHEAVAHCREISVAKKDVHEIEKMEENLHWLESEVKKVFLDALTGVYNRRYFDENIENIIKSLSRSGDVFSLMMIDIDHFKLYNDTYGHVEGDKCLKKITEAIVACITRAGDFIARYGGEEFVVVLPNTDEKGACMLADKLIVKVKELSIPHRDSTAADCVTISIGVTSGLADHSLSGDDYVKQADKLLYMSKQNGRNRYTFAPMSVSSQLSLSNDNRVLVESANRALDVAERRSALVGALNDTIGIYCEHSEKTFEEVLENGLQPMADVMRVHRIVILRHDIVDGKDELKQIYRWDKAEGGLTPLSFSYIPKSQKYGQ
jgi:diguanylate cyclase (GGDEF)-like protein